MCLFLLRIVSPFSVQLNFITEGLKICGNSYSIKLLFVTVPALSPLHYNSKSLCLICQRPVAACKVAHIRRHHETSRASFSTVLPPVSIAEEEKIACLKYSYFDTTMILTTATTAVEKAMSSCYFQSVQVGNSGRIVCRWQEQRRRGFCFCFLFLLTGPWPPVILLKWPLGEASWIPAVKHLQMLDPLSLCRKYRQLSPSSPL